MSIEVMESYEKNVIDFLAEQNLNLSYATVAVLMYSRKYHRPQNELTELLSRLAPQLSLDEIAEAVKWLINNKLVESIESQHQYNIYEVIADFPKRISELVDNIDVETKLAKLESVRREKVHVRFLDTVSANNNYETLLSAIMNARYSIKYPMLSTAPYEALVNTIRSAAQNGVKIKILLAEDNIVKKYKGNTKKSRIEDWKYKLNGVPNIEIKGFNEEEPTEICTSILIDEKKLRYVIYDPNTTTSLDGILLEVESIYGQKINIIKWFDTKFDRAWSQGATCKKQRIFRKIFSVTSCILIIFIICTVYLLYFFGYNTLYDQLALLIISPSGLHILSKIYLYVKQQLFRLKTAFISMGH